MAGPSVITTGAGPVPWVAAMPPVPFWPVAGSEVAAGEDAGGFSVTVADGVTETVADFGVLSVPAAGAEGVVPTTAAEAGGVVVEVTAAVESGVDVAGAGVPDAAPVAGAMPVAGSAWAVMPLPVAGVAGVSDGVVAPMAGAAGVPVPEGVGSVWAVAPPVAGATGGVTVFSGATGVV